MLIELNCTADMGAVYEHTLGFSEAATTMDYTQLQRALDYNVYVYVYVFPMKHHCT